MKTLMRLVFALAGICISIACSKTDQSVEEFSGVDLKKASPGFSVFEVLPNGADDTENLIQAFTNAKNAGPGSIVRLVEGEYFIRFIEIREFTGSFVGAGKGKTVITSLTGLNVDDLLAQKLLYFLIKFVGGDVYMGDMTLRTPPGYITISGGTLGGLNGLLLFSDYNQVYTSANQYIKGYVNNVDFIGERLPNGTSFNCSNALRAAYDSRVTTSNTLMRSHIDITITNCSFDSFSVGTQISWIKEGNLALGAKNNGNIFTNVVYSAFYDNINVKISVVGNTFNISKGCYGLDIDNVPYSRFIYEPQTKSTVCILEGNQFNHAGSYYALWLHDHRDISYPDEDMPMLCQVNNNRLNMSEGANCGIFTIELMNAVFRNNRFSGVVNYGMRISHGSTAYGPSENGLILGNNFSNTVFGTASVAFGPPASNWTVVGGGQMHESIIDLGTNNLVTGMNICTSEIPLGQTIVDNLEIMREALHKEDGQ
jgi:hypothetical protein